MNGARTVYAISYPTPLPFDRLRANGFGAQPDGFGAQREKLWQLGERVWYMRQTDQGVPRTIS